ncbi:virion core protein, T7 gp14 family [Phyllobacterium endophyticum]|uniref:virion core protein, T7 gp14 family n=1 Tax=Phyllobacterium endophyticum TaxID=1149773 RepID=UPI0011CB1E69|nr:hypothetical protein [Phyllobacterium endophyticum]TXR49888.1 hypothetical protein FVA77_07700 [Phyllobacterium endophyticum]
MCAPIIMGVISAGLGIASAVGQFSQQQQAADNQNKFYDQNMANSRAAYAQQTAQVQEREKQEQDAQAQTAFEMDQEAKRERAKIENDSASNSQAGLSRDSLLADIDRQEATRQAASSKNLAWTLADLNGQKAAYGSQLVSNINSVQRGQAPSFMDLGINIAGAALGGFNSYQGAKINQRKLAS